MVACSTDHPLWKEKWPAPAKLNLMLRIVGQRPDGYHLLQTVFQFVELCDWLTFCPAVNNEVHLANTIPGVPEDDDLTVKAARLLKVETGCNLGVTIAVEKNLPMGGGLGGGSSDAATTLVVLNKLWDLNLPTEELLALGLKLGADVPVFVFGHTAWAEGVGEQLEQISVSEKWVVILKPDCHVVTKEVFSAKNLTRNSKSIKITDFMLGDQRNDCLNVVSQIYPLVNEALNDLNKFSAAKLTGTGSCVFAQFESYADAKSAYDGLNGKWQAFLTKATNESVLISKLNKR